jgi:hypothetical protein
MFLLPIDQINVDHRKITELEDKVRAIYRLIIYSRYHLDDDLLYSYLIGMHNLKELVGIKNAQMEAQTDEEAEAATEAVPAGACTSQIGGIRALFRK